MNTFEVRKEIKNDLRKVLILCKIPYKNKDKKRTGQIFKASSVLI